MSRYSSDSVTWSQREQYQDPETEAAKLNYAIVLILLKCVIFLSLWHVKMSSVKKVYCGENQFSQIMFPCMV